MGNRAALLPEMPNANDACADRTRPIGL